MTIDMNQPGGPGAGVTLQGAADAFLSSARCENQNTRRAYAGVIDKLAAELGAGRELADVADDEIAAVLEALWATAAESTWNRNRAAVNAWLTWCRDHRRWPVVASSTDGAGRKTIVGGEASRVVVGARQVRPRRPTDRDRRHKPGRLQLQRGGLAI